MRRCVVHNGGVIYNVHSTVLIYNFLCRIIALHPNLFICFHCRDVVRFTSISRTVSVIFLSSAEVLSFLSEMLQELKNDVVISMAWYVR